MINVIVAEDKHPILRNIVKKIESFSPNVQVVGEATDGITALEMCIRLKPNIVFTDIRMPGIDGLQLIAELKKCAPDTVFIIISGYGDFEYAREAMRLGVSEFLLKPVAQDALDGILEKVTQRIESGQSAKEQQLISDLLRGRNSPATNEFLQLGNQDYFILVICAGSISRFLIDLANPFNDFWLQADLAGFFSSVASTAYECAWVFDGEAMNEVIVVFSCKKESTVDFTSIYNTFHHQYREANQYFTFAVSNKIENIMDLRLEYQLTRMILGKKAIFGKSSLLYVKELALNSLTDMDLENAYDKQKIIFLVKNKKKEAFLKEMETSFHQWELQCLSQSSIEYCLAQIIYTASHSSVEKKMINNDLKLELDEVISISRDYHALYKNMKFIFDKFFHSPHSSEPQPGSAKLIIERVESYFKDHLSEELTIADVAEMVNLNVSFLSREFKKIKGTTPIEYLTHLRIDKAKQLLTDPSNLKFKDIAAMVGYNNQYYFSKVFKLVTGLTPTEYKQVGSEKKAIFPE